MKNKPLKSEGGITAFIAAFCIVIYLFALVQASVRLYLSFEECKVTAGNEFTRVKNLAITTGSYGFMDDRFIQTMNGALLSSKMIEAIIVTGPDEDYAFEKQKGRAIKWVNRSPRFINRMSFSNVQYYEPLPINNIRNANIQAKANAFDYNDISKILRETLLLILIGFAVSFFTMLIHMLLSKPSDRNFTYVSTPAPSPRPAATPASMPAPVGAPVQVYVQQPEYAPVQQTRQNVPVESGPKGLYSARTNIGWEEYVKERLDAELHRCASTEKDLTLMMIEFTTSINDTTLKAISEEASTILSSKDMLFEYGIQGIYAILPGADLDVGIAKAEKFHQRVQQNHSGCDLSVGLSSRAGRLLNAERIILESKEALQRAKIDSSTSIIAFKSDPEKYRAFISQRDS